MLAIELLNFILIKYSEINQIDLIKQLSSEFNQTFGFIHSDYKVYKQFNSFIWTIVILQFILTKSSLLEESSSLNALIDLLMTEAQCDELPQLISCFDLINSLYENSISENEKDISENKVILHTPICQRMEDLDICLTEETEIKELTNNNLNLDLVNKSPNFTFLSEELVQKVENFKTLEDITQLSSDICMQITCDGELECEASYHKNHSLENLCPTVLGSCYTAFLEVIPDLDIEPNDSNLEIKRSGSNQEYNSRHQGLLIIKSLKRNSTKKLAIPRLFEGNFSEDDSFSEKQSSEEQVGCRRMNIRKSKKVGKRKS